MRGAFRMFSGINIPALLAALIMLSSCSPSEKTASPARSEGLIYLYGEQHGIEQIMNKEFELWRGYYQNENMRHLFVELPYYTAEFLNVWMSSDNDDILDELYGDWEGAAIHTPLTKEFYKKIKDECPETVFHGTDVGHQYYSTGERFLEYLKTNNSESSGRHSLTEEAIEQGKNFTRRNDAGYRENKMTENFIREFDGLNNESVMGIYGSAHTGGSGGLTDSDSIMINQLKKRYGNAVYSEDLAWLAKDIEPYRTDFLIVGGKEYEASYFGKEDLTGFKDYAYREFWRLEEAYDDFKDSPKTGNVLPYGNYPALIETGQVFLIEYIKTDGSAVKECHLADGYIWNDLPSTEEIRIN